MLDKARFEFSPLGKTFSTGLDKTAQGYQEEGIIKLLKDIRDGLACAITPRAPRALGLDGSDDDDHEQKRLSKLLGELRTNEDKLDKFVNDNGDDNMPDLETEEESIITNILNKINNFDEIVRNKKR